ncbi:putative tryptophanyl-tRNA synthetase [Trypanosoma cruzi]|uniref:Tryptophanyl-tRNA synthetase n=1 Tax=Trypanosoma cruzi TaxID=5693 RepID=A0A2V2UR71_TRYCR|nr:putative tryptophanyl-tRNA synthetase [Trypanosoma cruzi]
MRRVSRFAAPLVCGGRSCATTRGHDASRTERKEDVVTPWGVAATGPRGVDYDRVLARFRSEPVDEPLLQRLEETCNGRGEHAQATSTAQEEAGRMALHHFFRRGIVFSHRDFGAALDCVRASFATGTHRRVLVHWSWTERAVDAHWPCHAVFIDAVPAGCARSSVGDPDNR